MSAEKPPEGKAKTFDPGKHMMKISGRDYLPVAARLIWFREDHPDWSIVTEAVEIDHVKQFAVFRAQVSNPEGRVLATGTKFENRQGFADWLEKAESGSVGRALLMLGYGTANALEELDEGARLADSPQGSKGAPFQGGSQAGEGAPAARAAAGPAPGAVKPKAPLIDAYAIREEYVGLAKKAGFKDKPELDGFLRTKGIEKLDRAETMQKACGVIRAYIAAVDEGGDPFDWEESFEAENAKQAAAVV